MIVQCPKCNKKYIVDENEVPAGGAAVKCPNCGNVFTIYKEVSNIQLLPYEGMAAEATEEHESVGTATESMYGINKSGEFPDMEKPEMETETADSEEFSNESKIANDFEDLLNTSTAPEPQQEPEETAVEEPPTPEPAVSNDKISALWEKFKSLSGNETSETETESAPPESTPSFESNTGGMPGGTGAPTTIEPPVETPEPTLETAGTEEENKEYEKAKKLARALAKDIKLYHGDKVKQGLEQGNLVELIGSEIKKSWKFYQQKVSPQILQNTTYFEDALNEIVANGQKLFKFK